MIGRNWTALIYLWSYLKGRRITLSSSFIFRNGAFSNEAKVNDDIDPDGAHDNRL
jgi:hypothetical protein